MAQITITTSEGTHKYIKIFADVTGMTFEEASNFLLQYAVRESIKDSIILKAVTDSECLTKP